ncbi:toll/interleukin-1 receptor domain-containing protein [candidate division KSB1 bacterium]|nr:toll/interleukin-1 receptor domain-containing protein [candidate division KSB1 bacterium]
MGKKVFVSYSHKQGEWVWEKLVPVLKAGGAEVIIDRERFKSGRNFYTQMDEQQDEADVQLLMLSPDYLSSSACQHEMQRAIAKDPTFDKNCIVPVLLEACTLPDEIANNNPLYVNLTDDSDSPNWDLLM